MWDISVIIPTYNEAKDIGRCIECILDIAPDIELIVVDGGSLDETVNITRRYSVKTIQDIKNRAIQMNKGAERSRKDILLFLHADCLLEDNALSEIIKSIRDGYIGGCLSQEIDSSKIIYRFIEFSGNIRARMFKIFYGDQAIFVRKDIFFEIGGFDEVELFDDIIFSKKLRGKGKTVVLKQKVYTSPRRWERQGIIKTTIINWMISIGFFLKIPPSVLKKIYLDIR